MADLYLKALESERKQLWATCRLKGLARDTKERLRIADLDEKIAAHKAKVGAKPKPVTKGQAGGKAKSAGKGKAAGKAKPAAKPQAAAQNKG